MCRISLSGLGFVCVFGFGTAVATAAHSSSTNGLKGEDAADSKLPIRMAFGYHSSVPLVELDEQRPYSLKGGVLYRLGKQLTGVTSREVRYGRIPRRRLERELDNGHYHLYCFSNPKWLESEKYLWSPPLIEERNLVVVRTDSPDLQQVRDLHGKRIGTIGGFNYSPDFEQAFANGAMTRVDVVHNLQNLQKLRLKRVDAIIIQDWQFDYFKRQSGDDSLKKTQLVESQHSLHCAISNYEPQMATELLKALQQVDTKKLVGFSIHFRPITVQSD